MIRMLVLVAAASALVMSGCSQAVPAPPPTQALVVPAKAAEPAKAPAPTVQPTAVSAKKVDFPAQGKSITVIVPWAAAGGIDVVARLLAPGMEKELRVPVQVVNKPGAGGQVGVTEIAKSKPDGYTFGLATDIPAITPYLDPSRGAVYGRKDLQQIAMVADVPLVVAVKSDGPYKTAKDLVDAAKANPEGVKIGTAGFMNDTHLIALLFQKAAGVKFAFVHFDGGALGLAAMAGGHIDGAVGSISTMLPHLKSGAARLAGIMGEKRDAGYPDVKTMREQGYEVALSTSRGYHGPGGIPKEIADVLAGAIKKSGEDPEMRKKFDEQAIPPVYVGPAEYAAHFDRVEALLKPLVQQALEDQRNEPKK